MRLIKAVRLAVQTWARVIWRFLFTRRTTITNKVTQERLQICSVCPKYDKKRDLCLECLCYMKVKTKLIEAQCPDKWW
jgi:hypothetical protein